MQETATSSRTGVSTPEDWMLVIGAALAAVLLYLPDLGLMDFMMEEPRRVLIARAMVDGGDLLVPHLLGEAYLSKPPLFNWLVIACSLPGGEFTPFIARLPSLLSLALLVALMMWVTRGYLGYAARVFLAAALVVSPEVAIKAKLAEIEMLFALLVSASVWIWFARYEQGRRNFGLWPLPGLMLGLAFLSKREPSIAFFYLSVVPYLALRRDWRELFTWGHACCGAILLASAALWLVPVLREVGVDGYLANLSTQAQSGTKAHWTPQGFAINLIYYPVAVFGSALPWSALLLAMLSSKVRAAVSLQNRRLLQFAGLAVLVNLVPYTAIRLHLPTRYFLPMIPTLMVMAAVAFEALQASGALRCVTRTTTALLALIVVALAIFLMVGPFMARFGMPQMPLPKWLLPVAGLALAMLALSALRLDAAQAPRGLLTALLCLAIGVRLAEMNLLIPHRAAEQREEENTPAMLAMMKRLVPPSAWPIRVDTYLPYKVWLAAEKGMLTRDPAVATGRFTLAGFDSKRGKKPESCVATSHLVYGGRRFCLTEKQGQ